jgi:hypothetical protein
MDVVLTSFNTGSNFLHSIFNFSAQKLKNKKFKCNISFTDGPQSLLSFRILSLLPNSVEILCNKRHSGEKLRGV